MTSSPVRAVRDAVTRACADALAFVLPVECAGCGALDTALCEGCRVALVPRRVTTTTPGGLDVHGGLVFDGPVAHAMRALKAEGRTGLARAFAPALRAAALPALTGPGVCVVPVPTSRDAYRRRGYRVPELVAARAGLPVRRLLRVGRRTADQRGLDRDGRRGNVAGSLVARGAEGARILVVDDVVTTGATLDEAARALRAAGGTVLGAVVVAVVPRRVGPRDVGPVTRRIHT